MNEVQGPTRGCIQEQKKTGPEIRYANMGFIQETSYLQHMVKVQTEGRATGRQTYNKAQEGTNCPRLSLNEALVGVGGEPR